MRSGRQRGTLGIMGTLVWDRIVPSASPSDALEGWGGIAYALVAAAAVLPSGWTLRPLIKVGDDFDERARPLLRSLPRLDSSSMLTVRAPNNRVELRYHSDADRTERLSGGVPGWSAVELRRACTGCDALLVNFISGHELSLTAAEELRTGFPGPMYADLHSLFLGIESDGTRVPRALDEWRRWCACFDAVQMNEAEFALVASSVPDAPEREVLGTGVRLLAITRGRRGATYVTFDGEGCDPYQWSGRSTDSRSSSMAGARVVTRDVRLPAARRGDPTGCGDVWGAVMFARLLAGDGVRRSAEEANRLAALNVEQRGVERLMEAFASEEQP